MRMLVSVLLSLFFSIQAHAIDYVFERTPAGTFITAPWGTWQGYIASPVIYQPAGKTTHILSFEFETPNYFKNGNAGHFAVAVRGDSLSDVTDDGKQDLRGRGIILGSVQGYENNVGRCGPTSKENTIAIESFWGGGNCVYGPSTEGPSLQNNKRYKVEIKSRPISVFAKLYTEYTLWERSVDGSWVFLVNRGQWDDENYYTPTNLGGWWFLEVFSTHNWTFNIYNLQDTWQ